MKGKSTGKKLLRIFLTVLLVAVIVIFLLAMLGTVAHAAGLVDDTVDAGNLYSKYPLSNYQLDFYVDNSWSWLPWNWLDGIGKSVQYGLYCITNFVWTISLYLSNATGYVVQEAFKLDFINDMAESIGKSIQTLAGVTQNGFSSSGFYVGFLLLLILIVGIYVAYTGLIKRETIKALHAVINFVVVFLVSASFIAYAPDYIKKVNDFSSDISTASLDLGTKIMLPDSDSKGKDSVDLIRDSLFSIQVQQPWLLLQFGNSDIEQIGVDRVEALVSANPSDEDGETREQVVKTEIENMDNDNMTIPQVVNRLGMVFFLLFFNLGITIFVFLLTAMMIFSQLLFIIFAMFLPISFLLSMIPSYEGMAKQAIVKVFNTIMTRAGITLVVTVAFSISSMFYNLSTGYPFFMVAFLQIVCFAGIYMKLGDIMSMFSLNAGDSQSMGRRIFRRPYMFMRHRARRMERQMARAFGAGSMAGTVASPLVSGRGSARKANQNKEQRSNTTSESLASRAGAKAGAVMDTKNSVKDKTQQVKQNVKDLPTQAGYAVHSAKEKAKENVTDFKRGMVQEQETRQSGRVEKQKLHRQSVAQKRMALQKAKEARQAEKKADGSATKSKDRGATRQHERPVTASKSVQKETQKAQDKHRQAVSPVKQETQSKKERPVTSGATVKMPEQKQSIQRQNVKAVNNSSTMPQQQTRQTVQAQQTAKNQQTRQLKKKTAKKKGQMCIRDRSYLLAQERSWYDFLMDCLVDGGVMKRLDLAINDKAGILDIPELTQKCDNEECVSVFRSYKSYASGELIKSHEQDKAGMGHTLYIGSLKSEVYFCIYEKAYEQYAKLGIPIEETPVKNRFEIRLKNERAYYAVRDLLTYYDAERTAFSVINRYIRFVDKEDGVRRSEWETNERWAWFIGENRTALKLTTKPEPYTLERTLRWVARQVAPTLKMAKKIDRINGTNIIDSLVKDAKLTEKHEMIIQQQTVSVDELVEIEKEET